MRKGIALMIMMFGWLFGPPSAVEEAKKAYEAKRYTVAIPLYEGAFEAYQGQHATLNFNIAQCWLMQDSGQKAISWYGKVTNAHAENPQMASWAWNQIGTTFATGKDQPSQGQQQMNPGSQPGAAGSPSMPFGAGQGAGQGQTVSREKLEQALVAFKDALKLDNDNDIARYNYELIKRKLQQQDQNQDNQQNQDQQQQDQEKQQQDNQPKQKPQPQNQENQGNQGEPQDVEQMSQEEAERILAAMNANEKKFLQQIEKSKKHRTYNHDGPDW